MAAYPAWDGTQALAIVEARRDEKGAMLPILHDLQDRFGYIDDTVVPLIAAALNVSRAEVVGVIAFYHDFRRAAPTKPVLKLCRAESCQAAGCEDLVAHLETRHGLVADGHGGVVELETVYCLGHCAASPAAMLDGEPLAALTPASLDAALAEVAR